MAPGVAVSCNLLLSFLMLCHEMLMVTRHKELESSDPPRPGSKRSNFLRFCIDLFERTRNVCIAAAPSIG